MIHLKLLLTVIDRVKLSCTLRKVRDEKACENVANMENTGKVEKVC